MPTNMDYKSKYKKLPPLYSVDKYKGFVANIENETNSYGEPYIPQLGTINKVAFGMGIPARRGGGCETA